jgi:hypothetical protein
MNRSAISSPIAIPRGVTAIGIFLVFGAAMASLAGMTLVWPGTALDRMWAFNPRAFRELAPFGKTVGIPFLLLAVTLSITSVGWFKRRLWGWRLAVFIIATQVFGGLIHVFLGRVVEGGVGVAIAGALLLYLLRVKVRAVFNDGTGIPPCAKG